MQRCVLMSIRAEIVRTIFEKWTKRLEYRKRFGEFRGTVYVYASGAGGGHVVGAFTVNDVIRAERHKALTPKEWDILDRIKNDDKFNEFFSVKANTDKINALFIESPRRLVKPLTLEEFGKATGAKVVCAPQSWQYITTEGAEPESVAVELAGGKDDATTKFFKCEVKDECRQ